MVGTGDDQEGGAYVPCDERNVHAFWEGHANRDCLHGQVLGCDARAAKR